jgi:hypothetical protein
VLISTMIMECLQEKSTGLTQVDTENEEAGKSFTTGFVDDVTLWIGNMIRSLDEEESVETLLEETQQAAQCWESLLFSTSGQTVKMLLLPGVLGFQQGWRPKNAGTLGTSRNSKPHR